MNTELWAGVIEDCRRPADTPARGPDSYPQALFEIGRLYLPPDSVVEYLERAAAGKMSNEAAQWLERVKSAKGVIR
jgi:hypothetical protein